MSGDIQNQYEILKKQLKKIEYTEKISFEYVMQNNPVFFLRLFHYIMVEYNSNFYKQLVEKGYELYSKNDLRFTEQVFKLLQSELNLKLQINIAQFLSESYLEHKISLLNDVICEIQQKVKKEKKNLITPKGQENNSAISNQKFQPEKQKQQQQEQQQQFYISNNDDDDDDIEEQLTMPKPHKIQSIDDSIESKEELTQQICQQNQLFQDNRQNIIYTQKTQEIKTPLQIIPQKQNKNDINNNHSIELQQENPVTHQDLQKLMQVILLSNENIKSIMQKFSELQNTVNLALSNFDQRLTRLELRFSNQ